MKKNFSKLLFSNKKIIFGVLFFIFLGLALPFHQAKAYIPFVSEFADALVSVASTIFNLIAGLIFFFFGLLGAMLAGISASILNWVLSPNFISLSYTNSGLKPGDANFNEIVNIGWTLTRNLVNIGFILVLVFIGISTALRYGGYEMKKILPTFVLIALLINFTPVLLGFIIDASNIIMNFFLSDLGSGWEFFSSILQNQLGAVGNVPKDVLSGSSSAFLGTTMATAAFSFTAALILFLYAILFLARYVVLWVLVILSPLAFALYILPQTKSHFESWWKQFIHWCIVGIPAAFFLYLSKQVLYLTSPQCQAEKLLNCITLGNLGEKQPFGGALDSILPFGIVIIFLYLGLFLGLTSSAQGSAAIIAATKTRGKAAAKAIGERFRKGVVERTKLPEKTERYGRRLSEAKPSGAIGILEKWTGGEAVRHYVSRSMMGYGERYRGEYNTGLTELEKTNSLNIAAQMDYYPELKKAAALKIIAERGDLKKTGLANNDPKTISRISEILNNAKVYGKEKDIIKFLPQHAKLVGMEIKDAIKLLTPSDMEKFDKNIIIENEEVRKALIYTSGPEKISKLRHHGPDTISKVQETAEKEFNAEKREIIKTNLPFLRYSHSSSGLFKPIGDLKEIEKRAELIKMDDKTLQNTLQNKNKELALKIKKEEKEEIEKEIKIINEELADRKKPMSPSAEAGPIPPPSAKKSRGFSGPGTTDYKKPKGGFAGPGTTDYKKSEGGFKGPGTTK